MSKKESTNPKMTGKITMKNLVYDFSDPKNHKIVFPTEGRKLEGKSFFLDDSLEPLLDYIKNPAG